ncbi:MAG: BsuBI/PstI family type II restriction endonuclease [Terriglobales bacterium]
MRARPRRKPSQKVRQALQLLQSLGLPREQINERSALSLLGLLDLKPGSRWSEAGDPLRGITPLMDFFKENYGKRYKPNTRETVRRQTIHQFVDAGLVVPNPDDPNRPINSPKAVYQIEASALRLLRTFGTAEWETNLAVYLAAREPLSRRYAKEREMRRIPVFLSAGQTINLSPGGQNVLVARIIEDFAARFTPAGRVLYVGDTDEKFAYFDEEGVRGLGVEVEMHGKMPDVIIYHGAKNWLVLIEAVTTHGPVNPKRREELKRLFRASSAPLLFVTAFLNRRAMTRYLGDISWETEVWVAESPSHLIHFDGERFLGPYES